MKLVSIKFFPSSGETHLLRSDGKVATVPGPATEETKIVNTTYFPGMPALFLTTADCEDLVFELPTVESAAPLRSRPVIYLDQNAWSTISNALYFQERIDPEELEAALWLANLAREWKVVLPYSSGTLTETTRWTDSHRRYKLGLTICELSRGWQMLDPLALRTAEMRWVLSNHLGDLSTQLPQAWTLSPDAATATRLVPFEFKDTEGIDKKIVRDFQSIVSITSNVSVLLDDEPISKPDSIEWSRQWEALASFFHENKTPRHHRETAAYAKIMSDAGKEFANASLQIGMSAEDFGEWLRTTARQDIREMPAFGLAQEVTLLKLLNSQAKWSDNDLSDIFYFVQATGYAHATVGERSFATLTQNAQRRLNRPASCFSKIKDLRKSGLLDDLSSRPLEIRNEKWGCPQIVDS